MGFGSVVLLVTTILQQEIQLQKLHEDNLKQSHLRYLDSLHQDIQHLMARRLLASTNNELEFGDFVLSPLHKPTNTRIFNAYVVRLLELLAHYAEALALYRDNIDSYFEFKAHRSRVKYYFEFLGMHTNVLTASEQITLGFIRHHLEG